MKLRHNLGRNIDVTSAATGRLAVVLLATMIPCSLLAGENSKASRHAFRVERNVVYAEATDTKLKADIYIPTRSTKTSRPGILMIHGGAWMSGSKFNVAAHAMRLARSDYVVMAIDYRLAPKHKFPAQLEDCTSALEWFVKNSSRYNVDIKRMATYGYSAGGQLACLLGLKSVSNPITINGFEPVKMQAIVAGAAPCEFRVIPEQSTTLAYWLGGTRENVPDQYRDASPTTFVTKDAPPVFFFHGDQDKIVPLRSPKVLRDLLAKQKTPVEMKVIKDCGHVGAFFNGPAMDAARAFLDASLNVAQSELDAAERDAAIRLPESR